MTLAVSVKLHLPGPVLPTRDAAVDVWDQSKRISVLKTPSSGPVHP